MEVDQENNDNKKFDSYRRKQQYRNLLNRIEQIEESNDNGTNVVKEVSNILNEINAIDDECAFKDRVEYADETLLDSSVLSSASGTLTKYIRNVDIFTSNYDPLEFSQKFLSFINDNNDDDEDVAVENWLSLLEDARQVIPQVPNFCFLYGTFDPEELPKPKQKRERKPETQEKVEKKQLQKVHTLNKEEEGMDDTVKFLMKVLTDEYERNHFKSLNYFDFVIDSDSFTVTIENMFYTSFLIRDGKAELDVDDDNNPVIRPMKNRDLKIFRSEGGVNTQMIASFSMDIWETLKRKGHIQRHRNLIEINR